MSRERCSDSDLTTIIMAFLQCEETNTQTRDGMARLMRAIACQRLYM